jgi:hypothetical protein
LIAEESLMIGTSRLRRRVAVEAARNYNSKQTSNAFFGARNSVVLCK